MEEMREIQEQITKRHKEAGLVPASDLVMAIDHEDVEVVVQVNQQEKQVA